MAPEKLYSLREVAEQLGIHYQTLRTLTIEKDWPHRRVGRRWKYSASDVAAIIEAVKGEPAPRKGRPRRDVA